MGLVSRGLEDREIRFRGIGHLLVAVVEDIDGVRASLRVSVEHQAAGQVARFRAVLGKAAEDVALKLR